jgi:hypothetical protein
MITINNKTSPSFDEDPPATSRSRLPHGANKHTLRERPLLQALAGWNQGEVFAVPTVGVIVGRGHGAGIRLRDRRISLHHARLEPTDAGVVIEDLGSASGTYVNGLAVQQAVLLEGDKIRIGPTTVLRFGCYYDFDEGYLRHMQKALLRSREELSRRSDFPGPRSRPLAA